MTKRENGDRMNIVNIIVREYEKRDVTAMAEIWNEVAEAGNAFPQMDRLAEKETGEFFGERRAYIQRRLCGGTGSKRPADRGKLSVLKGGTYEISTGI